MRHLVTWIWALIMAGVCHSSLASTRTPALLMRACTLAPVTLTTSSTLAPNTRMLSSLATSKPLTTMSLPVLAPSSSRLVAPASLCPV